MSLDADHDADLASTNLRHELKEWEKLFADRHGRKPGRDDIKKDATIASKYKEYNKLRDPHSQKPTQATPSAKKASHKRKAQHTTPSQTPRHHRTQRLPDVTPSKTIHPSTLDLYDSPASVRKLFTPSSHKRTAIGPTPQKDGQVLGLFDLLPGEETPMKSMNRTPLEGVAGNAQGYILATPSRRRTANVLDLDNAPETGHRANRTPTSASKRFFLDTFATPMKRKRGGGDAGTTSEAGTPSTTNSRKHFSTPSFLRRDSQRLPHVTEEGETSPVAVRMPQRRPLVRSLSSMLAGLRKMEDEKLDEEMELMHEFEGQTDDASSLGRSRPSQVLVEDSQAASSSLLPIHEEDEDEDEDEELKKEGLDRNGKPLKVWKKRGQKRTTRRVLLRPVRHTARPPTLTAASIPEENEDETESENGPEHATESEHQKPDQDEERDPDADYAPPSPGHSSLAHDTADIPSPSKRRKLSPTHHLPLPPPLSNTGSAKTNAKAQAKEKETAKADPAPSKPSIGATVANAVRKTSAAAVAHANFRRLKLRNKGAKGGGGGGGGGRFGRRK
ncbi:MAG: hypothetical protein M1819_000873 [Sarea resinae]|nr:MAG: hypothetical protein M1819_000873 [Sarea resinae]